MHDFLESLTNVALLGTEKRNLPDVDPGIAPLIADAQTPEEQLLTLLGATALYVRSGKEPATGNRLHLAPAPDEEKASISDNATYYLRQIISGPLQDLLPEFLAVVRQADKCIPHSVLPELLVLGQKKSTLQPVIITSLTERGAWLARQNPEWAYAIQTSNPQETFETADHAERLVALQALRQADPDGARTLLMQDWAKEKAQIRADLLQGLQVNLSLADEAVLEAALDDKSKTVRKVAADQLAQLPDSAYTRRMIERAKPQVQMRAGGMLGLKRAKLVITFPDWPDENGPGKEAERDGLDEPRLHRKVGERAWFFWQVMSRVPLSTWKEMGELSQLLNACPEEERVMLFNSFVDSCQRNPSADDAAALIEHDPADQTIAKMGRYLTPERAAELASAMLRTESNLTPDHPLLSLMKAKQFAWSASLKEQLQRSLSRSIDKWTRSWDAKSILDNFAQNLPLDLLDDCAKLAPQKPEHPAYSAYSEFSRVADFRQKMVAAVLDS